MKRQEAVDLGNMIIHKCNLVQDRQQYSKSTDPERSFWQGFDCAIEVVFDAIKDVISVDPEYRDDTETVTFRGKVSPENMKIFFLEVKKEEVDK